MTRSRRTGSASLEGVESGASLGLQFGGAGGVLPHYEDASRQSGEEGEDAEEEGDHTQNEAILKRLT